MKKNIHRRDAEAQRNSSFVFPSKKALRLSVSAVYFAFVFNI
jgi:hypothetical protein